MSIPDSLGVGSTDYQLYVYPDTEVLRFVSWDLEYSALDEQNLRRIADFPSWQNENGVLVPKVVRLYTATGSITTEMEPDIFFYDEVQFSSSPFKDALFEMPNGVIIDESAK